MGFLGGGVEEVGSGGRGSGKRWNRRWDRESEGEGEIVKGIGKRGGGRRGRGELRKEIKEGDERMRGRLVNAAWDICVPGMLTRNFDEVDG